MQSIISELLVLITKGGSACPLTPPPRFDQGCSCSARIIELPMHEMPRRFLRACHTLASAKSQAGKRSALAAAVCREPCLEPVWANSSWSRCEPKRTRLGTRHMCHRGIECRTERNTHLKCSLQLLRMAEVFWHVFLRFPFTITNE